MTPAEMAEWREYHLGLFPHFRDWWDKNSNEALAAIWQEQLSQIDLAEAKEASGSMLSGAFEAEHPPTWDYNALPRYIAGVVRTIRNARVESEQRALQRMEFEEQRKRRAYYDNATEAIADKLTGGQALQAAEQANQNESYNHKERIRTAAMNFIRSKREDPNSRLSEHSGYVKRYRWAFTDEDMEEIRLYDRCKDQAIG